ncbi:hypothetical protein EG328_001385 [Venturia inaequalis]|uniref:Uncharacterized protein n=1 Tax=Venturia inaequalis TaxID=5025 RepID=A0A8H3YYK9_VENIN|nr:hypothetical protein EG328_001385 [Venturia inaequalis]KAE9990592.1 hypothetical protein EG327_001235 [Venturia inaequalis]
MQPSRGALHVLPDTCEAGGKDDADVVPAQRALLRLFQRYTQVGSAEHENGIVPLGFCPDTKKYCCNRSVRKLNAECCDPSIPENVILDDLPTASMIAVTTSYAGFLATTALPTMASATASATATPRLSSPSTSTAADAGKSSGLTVGAGVGVGAGVASGFFLLLIGIAFLRLRRGGRGRVVAPAELSGTQVHELR